MDYITYTANRMARERLWRLTKPKLLGLLEEVPQIYWPPRPTRQTVGTLRQAIYRALGDSNAAAIRCAIADAVRPS